MTSAAPKTLVILGATSAVAIAFARQACRSGNPKLILVGRSEVRLNEILADMKARGANESSQTVAGELGEPDAVSSLFAEITAGGVVDEVLLAYGLLGEQVDLQNNPSEVHNLMDVNLVSAVMWCETFAAHFETNRHGKLAVIGSVAGDRGRQSNYLYGATKGALERVCEGMAHRFVGTKEISVTLIKPGFIDSPMTAHIEKGGPLWASPEKVADSIHRAMKKRRVRVYAPWFWRWILLIIRSLPVPIMHKTKM